MNSLRRGACILALSCGAASWAMADAVEVRLTEQPHKEYTVEGVFLVKASSAAVWGALTDYDHIDRFVPSMRQSRVVETRPDGSLIVEQEAVGSILFFSKAVHVRLEVRRDDQEELRFQDLVRKDFRRNAGSWRVRSLGAGSEVTYRLVAVPGFAAPSVMLRRGFKRGAKDLLDQVRVEILRRAKT